MKNDLSYVYYFHMSIYCQLGIFSCNLICQSFILHEKNCYGTSFEEFKDVMPTFKHIFTPPKIFFAPASKNIYLLPPLPLILYMYKNEGGLILSNLFYKLCFELKMVCLYALLFSVGGRGVNAFQNLSNFFLCLVICIDFICLFWYKF